MIKGFFEIEKPITIRKPNRKAYNCESCGLYKQVKSPKMPYTGEGKLNAFILSEAPGRTEDLQNKQLVGDAGNVLREALKENGYDLDRDFFKTNSISCRPTDKDGNNRTPTKNEIIACEPNWRKEIEALKPKFILLMGAKAVEAFYMYRSHPISNDLSIGRWCRTCVPDIQTKAWVISLYHPSFAVRTPDFLPKFKLDLRWALAQLKRKPPEFKDWSKAATKLYGWNDVMTLLNDEMSKKYPIAIDYETSSLRAYNPGNHIWSISMARMYQGKIVDSCAFPFSYPGHWKDSDFEMISKAWKSILSNPDIPKIAQNIQFEESWGRQILGVETQGWIHDTMVCAHVINEHRKVTKLDFQVFSNWGFEYGENIEPYKNGGNDEFNRMHEVPLSQLLEYNAMDSLFCGLLYQKQVKQIGS